MSNWRNTLDRIGGRGQRFRGFLRWWGGALASWLPARWRRLLGLDPDRLLLSAQFDQLLLQRQTADTLSEVATLPLPLQAAELERVLPPALARLPRWLLLPNPQVLRRELNLPLSAADHLREVVGFEIDRQTPFVANQVHYDTRLLSTNVDTEQLRAELVVVPQSRLNATLEPLGDLASTVAGVDVQGSDGHALGVNLLPSELRAHRADPFRSRNLILATVGLLALVLTGLQTLDNRRDAADAFSKSLDAQSAKARAVSLQRQQLTDLVEGQAFLDQKRKSQPAAVEVLDEVARRLPDDSYLEKLAIEGEQLSLIGLSGNASSLVARLEGAPLWRKPALTGAVQTDPATRRDRFSLSANLVSTNPPTNSAAKPANDARLP